MFCFKSNKGKKNKTKQIKTVNTVGQQDWGGLSSLANPKIIWDPILGNVSPFQQPPVTSHSSEPASLAVQLSSPIPLSSLANSPYSSLSYLVQQLKWNERVERVEISRFLRQQYLRVHHINSQKGHPLGSRQLHGKFYHTADRPTSSPRGWFKSSPLAEMQQSREPTLKSLLENWQ